MCSSSRSRKREHVLVLADVRLQRATPATAYARLGRALPTPSWLLTALRAAAASRWSYPTSLLVDALVPAPDQGQGRPVLVHPGLLLPRRRHPALPHATCGGSATARTAGGSGRNHGLTDPIIDGVLARFDEVHERYDEPVSVVGWSFGGLLARWVAHQRPDAVRQVVCLGSPYRPEGEHTRTTPLFERSARTHGLSDAGLRGRRHAARAAAGAGHGDLLRDRRHRELARAARSPTPSRSGDEHRGPEQPRRPAHQPALARRAGRPARPGPGRLAAVRLGQLPEAPLGRVPTRSDARRERDRPARGRRSASGWPTATASTSPG